jgi:hypothetical protein
MEQDKLSATIKKGAPKTGTLFVLPDIISATTWRR